MRWFEKVKLLYTNIIDLSSFVNHILLKGREQEQYSTKIIFIHFILAFCYFVQLFLESMRRKYEHLQENTSLFNVFFTILQGKKENNMYVKRIIRSHTQE